MAHGFLSYQDTRGEVDYLGMVGRALKDRLKKRGKKGKKGSGNVELEKDGDSVEPIDTSEEKPFKPFFNYGEIRKEKGGAITMLGNSGLSKAVGVGTSPALPEGAKAVNPEVLGGALTRISRKPGIDAGSEIYDTTATRIDDPAGSLQGIGELIVRSNNNIVEAISGLQRVTVRVLDSIETQTEVQKALAMAQAAQQEQLAARQTALLEASQFKDQTKGNQFLDIESPGSNTKKGGGILDFFGGGLDLMGGRYMRRGVGVPRQIGARRRLAGRALGRAGTKAGTKSAAKIGAKALGKGLLKKIPLLGLGAGALFAAERAMAGDWGGAGLELASGGASMIPGLGTAASVGIDAALAGRDMGLTPFADGGIITQPTASLMGEKGNEGVFPLEGRRGKETFVKFGEGILEAQKRNKKEYARLQALGLEEYSKKAEQGGGFNLFNPLTWGQRNENQDDPWARVDASGRVIPSTPGSSPYTGSTAASDFSAVLPSGNPVFNSGFGQRDIGYGSKDHRGIDIGVDRGTPVLSMEKGKVSHVIDDFDFGSAVVVTSESGAATLYGHVDPTVKVGDEVNKGDKVATVKYWPGSGNMPADNTHLHLERHPNGYAGRSSAVDPNDFVRSASAATNEGLNNPVVEPPTESSSGEPAAAPGVGPGSGKDPGDINPDWTSRVTGGAGIPEGPSHKIRLSNGMFAYRTRRVYDGKPYKGWKIQTGGLLPMDFETRGKNEEQLREILEEGIRKERERKGLNLRSSAAAVKPGAYADAGSTINTKSFETAAASTMQPVINNNYFTGEGGQEKTFNGGTVAFGASSDNMGTSAFADLSIRSMS